MSKKINKKQAKKSFLRLYDFSKKSKGKKIEAF
jgi:hypothetical protein